MLSSTQPVPNSLPTSRSGDVLRYAALFLVSAALVVLIGLTSIDAASEGIDRVDPQNDDSRQNLTYAYNLAKYGVFSRSTLDNTNIVPDSYREPAYPALVALGLSTFTDIRSVSYQCFIEDDSCAYLRLAAKRINIFLMVILAWATGFTVVSLSKRWIAGCLAVGLLISVNFFYFNSSLTELPAALLVLLHALFMYMAFKSYPLQRRSMWGYALVSGVALGLLVLTKAIFFYWMVVLIGGVVAYFAYRLIRGRARRQGLALALVLLVPALIISGLWMLRNYTNFGEYKVAGRDAAVLAIRAEYTYMQPKEYAASFAYFAPSVVRPLLLRFFDEADYSRLNRSDINSYYMRVTRATADSEVVTLAREKYGMSPAGNAPEGTFVLAELSEQDEAAVSAAAIETIRERWDKYLLLTFNFAYNGAFVPIARYNPEYGGLFQTILLAIAGICSVFFVPSLIGVSIGALVKRNFPLFMFFTPALFSFGIYAVASNFIPRYSTPLVPIFITAFFLALVGILTWIRNRFSARRASA